MKLIIKLFCLWIMAVFLSVNSAEAIIISFTDGPNINGKHSWPGWENTSGDDNQNTIGIPDFLGGRVTIENGSITKVEIDYEGNSSYWGALFPGDLFINTGDDNDWDYLVNLFTDPVGPAPDNIDIGHVPSIKTPGTYNLYHIDGQFVKNGTDGNYILSGKDQQGNWEGISSNNRFNVNFNIRDDHPVSLNNLGSLTPLSTTITFSGWPETNPGGGATRTATFDFANYNIDIGVDDVIIGWTLNCANDVVYANIDNPVPEPATMMLFGSGIIGLAGFGRKKFMKS